MNKSIKSMLLFTMIIILLAGIPSVNAAGGYNSTSQIDATANDLTDSISTSHDNIATDKISTDKATDKKTTTKKQAAANKTVKTTDEIDYYVSDTMGQDTNDGTKGNPFKTIQTAINKTTADSTYNIHITAGTYKGTGNTNLSVNGNYNIKFIGEGINVTFIDGEANYTLGGASVWGDSPYWNPYENGAGNYIMNITSGTGLITLTNFTIQHSWVYATGGGDSISKYPTATLDNYGNLKVENMYFYQNYAGVGAGIRNNANATLTVNNTTFDSNRKSESTGNFGAGVYNNGTATITNSIFTNNAARWGTVTNDKVLNISNCIFKDGISYDLASTYKYGSGIASNTGSSDYYISYEIAGLATNVDNCTFINNGQTDIYHGPGNLNVSNSKFINSTGIYLTSPFVDLDQHHNIANNTFANMQPSTIFLSLSVKTPTAFSIYSRSKINTTIENNAMDSQSGYGIYATQYTTIKNNTLNRYIYLNRGENTIINNNIQVNDLNYTIALASSGSASGNIITNNYLITNTTLSAGDYSINRNKYANTIENNTPSFKGYIFASPTVTTPTTGNPNDPTTLADAINKANNTSTIYLFAEDNTTYSLNETITLNSTNLNANTTTVRIRTYIEENNPAAITGNDKISLFNVSEGYTLILNNITLSNGKATNGGLIYSEGNVTITNSTLENSYADNGGAIYTTGNANTNLANNTFANITSLNETLNLNSTGTNGLTGNSYKNCDIILKKFMITSDSSNSYPIRTNDTIKININNIKLENPNYYDNAILEDITYNIYKNDELINTTTQKTYTLKITNLGNTTSYATLSFSNNKSNTLTFANKLNANITIDDITAVYGEEFTLTAALKDENGNLISGGKAAFKLNGKTLKDANGNVIYVQVANGVAAITLDGIYSAKSYAISVVYSGCDIYSSQRANSKLTIIKANLTAMTVVPSACTITQGEAMTVTVTVNNGNAAINTGKVVLKLNGCTIKDSNGNVIYGYVKNSKAQITVKIPVNMKSKVYNLTAVYSNKNYNRCEASANITLIRKV